MDYLSPHTSELLSAIDEHISNPPSPSRTAVGDDEDFLMDMNKEEEEEVVEAISTSSTSAVNNADVSVVLSDVQGGGDHNNNMYNDDTTASVPVVEDAGTLFSPSLEKLSALYNSAESQRPSNFKHGEECIVCGEILLYPVSAYDLDNRDVPDAESRSIQCPAGHQFCLNCWRSSVQMQVREGTGLSLQCPGSR